MQTFFCYPSSELTAKCLDNKRLGKQRVEAYQILKANLQGPEVAFKNEQLNSCKSRVLLWFKPLNSGDGVIKTPWYNHPATVMWRGCEFELMNYIISICCEWRSRGYKDEVERKSLDLFKLSDSSRQGIKKPSWIGDEKFHASHRSNLLRKNKEYYSQFGWTEKEDLSYVWPKN